MRALLILVALTAGCVPLGAQAAVPVLTDYSATIKGVTAGGVTCIFWARLADYYAGTPWESEIDCKDAAGSTQLQVRRTGAAMVGSYPLPPTLASIAWIVTPGPTAGSTVGMTIHFGYVAADGTGTFWDRTF